MTPLQKLRTIMLLPVLVLRALLSGRRIADPSGRGTITCTTYGPRQWSSLLTLDSLSRGTVRPARVLLFLDQPHYDIRALPLSIRALRRRGVEVRLVPHDDGSFKKLPVAESPDIGQQAPVITVDDDTFLERDWLAGLLRAHEGHPDTVLCYRARRIVLDQGGGFAPYQTWPVVMEEETSRHLMPTGMGGILYPPRAIEAIRRKGTGFRGLVSNCDDLWFRFCTLEVGMPVRLLRPASRPLKKIPFTQSRALWRSNVSGPANDQAIAVLRPLFDLRRLEAA